VDTLAAQTRLVASSCLVLAAGVARSETGCSWLCEQTDGLTATLLNASFPLRGTGALYDNTIRERCLTWTRKRSIQL